MDLHALFDIWCQSADTSLPFLEMFKVRQRLACCCRSVSSACNEKQPEGAFFWFFSNEESVPTPDESSSESNGSENNDRRTLNFSATYQEIEDAAMRYFYVDHPLEFLDNVRQTLHALKEDIHAHAESFGIPGAWVGVSVRALGFTAQDRNDWVDNVPVHFSSIPVIEISYETDDRIFRREEGRNWIALVAGYVRIPMMLTLLQAAASQRLYVQGIERNRFVMYMDNVSVYGDWWKNVFTWTNAYQLLLHE